MDGQLNVRRVLLDVDLSMRGPTLTAVAAAIQSSPGVAACSITVTEIDTETIGTDVTIEGENMDYESIVEAIEKQGPWSTVLTTLPRATGLSKACQDADETRPPPAMVP